MTSIEHQPTNRSNRKAAVAAVSTLAALLIVIAGLLLQQRSENRMLQEQLRDARDRLEQHGAIELTDSRRLHLRWLPARQRQEEVACRIHVPANQAYRLMLHAGQIPPKGLPDDESGFRGLPIEIPTHHVDREITAIGGLNFNTKQKTWEIFCRISDVSGIEYPLNGTTLFLPPDGQRYFYLDQAVRMFESGVDRTKTCVYNEEEDQLLLAVARAYEPPLDAEGNVDYGGVSPLEWVQTQKNNLATGFMFWIEKDSGDTRD